MLSAETTGLGDDTYYSYDAAGRREILRTTGPVHNAYYNYDDAGPG